MGNVQAGSKAYMWCRMLGIEGLRQVAVTSVMNNQYMLAEIMDKVPGVALRYDTGNRRMEQTRPSFGPLMEETGCGVIDVNHRIGRLWNIRIMDVTSPIYGAGTVHSGTM